MLSGDINMSNLEKYIQDLKEMLMSANLNEIELVRYVYLDLGKRFAFNVEFFYGTSKIKKEIYIHSKQTEDLEESMKTNIVICKSAAYIIEYILKRLGVDICTVVDQGDYDNKCPHVYNIVKSKERQAYMIDLQKDMKNIQSNSFTSNFGLSVESNELPIISRQVIEQIDRKLNYINDENYYADEYLDLLELNMGYFSDFASKVQFVLENIDVYENKDMSYTNRYWHHQKILRRLFSMQELKKIRQLDCYKESEEGKECRNCIAVDKSKGTDVYMYSEEESKYCKISVQEFAKLIQDGLKCKQGILGLKQALKQLKEKEEENEKGL